MPARPNFTGATIIDDSVRVEGVSDDDDTADILDIRVTLVQGDRIASASVGKVTSVWNAVFDVKDPEGVAGDFRRDQVAAFGVETRRKNVTTITWAETLTIS